MIKIRAETTLLPIILAITTYYVDFVLGKWLISKYILISITQYNSWFDKMSLTIIFLKYPESRIIYTHGYYSTTVAINKTINFR